MSILNNPLVFILIEAMILAESGGDDTKIGDNGQSFGCLQIQQIMVDDVNRIIRERNPSSKTRYVHADAFDREKSKSMVFEYSRHYCNHLQNTAGRKATFEDIARMWNDGGGVWDDPKTEYHWGKVLLAFDSLIKECPTAKNYILDK